MLKLSQIAESLNLEWHGEEDPVIIGPGSAESAEEGEIIFIDDSRYEKFLESSSAAAAILPADIESNIPFIKSENPRADFTKILEIFSVPIEQIISTGIDDSAKIHPTAIIGDCVSIGPFCVIGAGCEIGLNTKLAPHTVIEPNCKIGSNCLFYSHVTIRHGSLIGNNVILHPGAVVGSDGFGYHPSPTGLTKIPQIGNVVIEDDVEIGANSCVDRSTTGTTVIAKGTKLDNLVQIGHNVTVGAHTAISAQSGVSGSCKIGKGVVIGGQSGCADHLTIGDGVKIAAKTAVTRDVEPGKTVFGSPEIEIKKGFRLVALTRRLPDLFKRVRDLENLVSKHIK